MRYTLYRIQYRTSWSNIYWKPVFSVDEKHINSIEEAEKYFSPLVLRSDSWPKSEDYEYSDDMFYDEYSDGNIYYQELGLVILEDSNVKYEDIYE